MEVEVKFGQQSSCCLFGVSNLCSCVISFTLFLAVAGEGNYEGQITNEVVVLNAKTLD